MINASKQINIFIYDSEIVTSKYLGTCSGVLSICITNDDIKRLSVLHLKLGFFP